MFSVLVPFVDTAEGLSLLFERRAFDMASQPGEICFPGGHVEEGESTLDCALRETAEEVGIPRGRIEVLGEGDILYGYANYSLYTYPGYIRDYRPEQLKLQESEVAEVFTLPFAAFSSQEAKVITQEIRPDVAGFPYAEVGVSEDYRWYTARWEVPIYHVGPRIVWGMTANIIRNMVKRFREAGMI